MVSRIPQKFDPSAQLVAARSLVLNGSSLAPGDPVTTEIPTRRLKQLYDSRRVCMITTDQSAASSAKKGKRK